MFENLHEQPADPILALMSLFRADPRRDKLDLGIGVYRDDDGRTPVFRAVKTAERILVDTQTTKTYLGPEGDLDFIRLIKPLLFGKTQENRIAGAQTPGGTGALRVAAELIAKACPETTIWLGDPTWPNHSSIFSAAKIRVAHYRYFDFERQSVRFDEMVSALSGANAGDVVLLHACCHNPTGADLDDRQWDAIAGIVSRRGLIPLIDCAYQGLGTGLESDVRGLRLVCNSAEQALFSYSCDKNFGLYRERTGAVFALAETSAQAQVVADNIGALARANWSMPPDHGAAIVRTILEDPDLVVAWREELDAMCQRIRSVRTALAAASPSLDSMPEQKGLFANLAISKESIDRLRMDFGVYMAPNGRVNIAGLRSSEISSFVESLRAVDALPE